MKTKICKECKKLRVVCRGMCRKCYARWYFNTKKGKEARKVAKTNYLNRMTRTEEGVNDYADRMMNNIEIIRKSRYK